MSSTTILTSYFTVHSVTSSTISAHLHSSLDVDDSTIRHTSTVHYAKIHPFPLTHPTFPEPTTWPTETKPADIPFHTGATPPFQQSGQKPIFVVFEVLGGLLASGLLLGLGRCCYQYKKAPKRDRIAEVLNRHNLQRELEELERNPQILRRPSLREPAPPYYPAPPSYEVNSAESPIVADTNYTDMGPHNLSSSSSPQPSILIPPRPAG